MDIKIGPIKIDKNFLQRYNHHINNVDTEFRNIGRGSNINILKDEIKKYLNTKPNDYNLKILEIGTKRSNPNVSTHHKDYFKEFNCDFIMTDFQDGLDVDIVCDVHKLSSKFKDIDVIITCSGYEHFKYPQLASLEILKSLKKGGLIYLQSHQTFPLHGYPCDYFRFSLDAYKSCFPPTLNCEMIGGAYSFPALILPIENIENIDSYPWNWFAKSYRNSECIIKKKGETPDNFIYDL